MTVLGLLLVVAALTGVLVFVVDGSATSGIAVTLLDRTAETAQINIFLADAVTAVVFLTGLLLMTGGARRAAARRRELYRARLAAQERANRLEAEKRELQRRLQAVPRGEPASTAEGAAPAPPSGGDRLVAGSTRRGRAPTRVYSAVCG